MYTHLEDYINNLYTAIGIRKPSQLCKDAIAKKLGIDIIYKKKSFRLDNEIILSKNSLSAEWMSFGHELGHLLRHCGSQLNMNPLFVELQEWQADNFAFHFCVPTFMLEKLTCNNVEDIKEIFNVDYDFACKRLEMYKNKLYQEELYYIAK